MDDMVNTLLYLLFDTFNGIENATTGDASLFADVAPAVNAIATLIKPIGYSFLALFAMIEFARLSERVGNVTGFMGAGLVINVIVKLLLCKLVVDNSTEICDFILEQTNNIGNIITGAEIGSATLSLTEKLTFSNNINIVYGDMGILDILPKLEFFVVFFIIFIISWLSILVVRIVYLLRLMEIYVYTAISPIPLSTTLSRDFNMAPNYLKSFFAVGLQGALLFLVVKIFSIMFANVVRNVGELEAGDYLGLWAPLGVMLLMCLAMVVSAFATGRWAKSICSAM